MKKLVSVKVSAYRQVYSSSRCNQVIFLQMAGVKPLISQRKARVYLSRLARSFKRLPTKKSFQLLARFTSHNPHLKPLPSKIRSRRCKSNLNKSKRGISSFQRRLRCSQSPSHRKSKKSIGSSWIIPN